MKRRDFLGLAACVGIGIAGTKMATYDAVSAARGPLRQGLSHACLAAAAGWTILDTIKAALQLGCTSVEGVTPAEWDILLRHQLTCAVVEAHPMQRGMNNPLFWDANLPAVAALIDRCAERGFPNVLCYTGPADTTSLGGSRIARDAGRAHCIEAFKKLIAQAEQRGVTLLLEPVNSRPETEMRGCPGYQGDDVGYCAGIVRAVDSPRMKLLFDVYHVQVMHGDPPRQLEACRDILGHVQTGGSPGRREIGPQQEINYAAIARRLVELGYKGFVGHEFYPSRDPMAGLREAVKTCTVADHA